MAIIELDQGVETPVTEYTRGAFQLRYGYARAKDAIATNLRGEDYLVTRVEGNRLAFAICDGVGSSFFGGWASQILGEKIIQWLWEEKTRRFLSTDPPSTAVKSKIASMLNAEIHTASEIVRQKDLSKLSNQMLRNTYINRLEESGSQSNFVCGYIEAGTSIDDLGCLWLLWLGDAKLRIWKDEYEKTNELNGRWLSEQSWSTKFGVAGEIFSFKSTPGNVNKILAYTDGLLPYERQITHSVETAFLNQILENQRNRSGSDDISFLEISIVEIKDFSDDLVQVLRNVPIRTDVSVAKPETSPEPRDEKSKNGNKHFSKAMLVLAAFLCYIVGLGMGYFMGYSGWGDVTPTLTLTHTVQPIRPTITPDLATATLTIEFTPTIPPSVTLPVIVIVDTSTPTSLTPTDSPTTTLTETPTPTSTYTPQPAP